MTKRDHYTELINKYCVFGIRLFAILILINLFIAIILQGRSLPHGTLRMIILEAFLVGAWFTNKKNTHLSTQLYLVGVFWAFLLYPLTPFFTSKPAEDLFLYIFITLILNSLVIVLIESRFRLLIGFWLILTNATFIYGLRVSIQRLNPETYTPIKDIFVEVPILLYSFTIIFVFISLVTRKFKTEQQNAKKNLDEATHELSSERTKVEQQQMLLTKTIEELTQSENELKEINSSIESRIKERLNELQAMNERILNHGFLNSVNIRNSFKKILLSEADVSKMDEETLYSHYLQVTNELDEIINSIGENLQLTDSELNE